MSIWDSLKKLWFFYCQIINWLFGLILRFEAKSFIIGTFVIRLIFLLIALILDKN